MHLIALSVTDKFELKKQWEQSYKHMRGLHCKAMAAVSVKIDPYQQIHVKSTLLRFFGSFTAMTKDTAHRSREHISYPVVPDMTDCYTWSFPEFNPFCAHLYVFSCFKMFALAQ